MGLTDRAELLRKAALGRGRPGLGGAGSGGTRDEESFEREALSPLTADLAQTTIPSSIAGFSIPEQHATKWPPDWPGHLPCHRNSPPIPGLLELPSGTCAVVDYDIPASELLGGPVPSLGHREVSLLWRVPLPAKELDPDRVVFLDTETTGLSGGTGTYVFMVGLGRFRGDSFKLRQLFLRDLHLEEAFLEAMAGE
ncbi:MAG: ribonuclease H-like domain-containing protein, partial [Firmicutes bacterium]|nr:ribonuclease H-like domain-containing protein [Bacillota bacterium]